jgi:hypothetical protein
MKDYEVPEREGLLPTMLLNSVVSKDGRKMIICTRPVRFMMKPLNDTAFHRSYESDAIDFNSMFVRQNATDISMLSALRMNATFPYALPNVWLPTQPIIDVMDAGLRDNYGQENTLRFIDNFKDWLQENTSKVVIIDIRDGSENTWNNSLNEHNILEFLTKPVALLRDNWSVMQDYYQHDALEYASKNYGKNLQTIMFRYTPSKKGNPAGLSFHLTAAEKKDIAASLYDKTNAEALKRLKDTAEK